MTSRRSLLILAIGWLCLGCFLPQQQRLAGCVPCAAGTWLSCSCCPALCPLTGHPWHPAPRLHAKVHSKGRAGTSAGSTGQHFLALLSHGQLFTSATHVHARLYGCRGKESRVALTHPLGSKVGRVSAGGAGLCFAVWLSQVGLRAEGAGTGH